MDRRIFLGSLAAAPAIALWPRVSHASERVDVALGGFAFAGDAATLDARFPLSRRYEKERAAAGNPIYRQLLDAAARRPAAALRLTGGIDELKGRDQALAVALVVGSEFSSVEAFGRLHKLFSLVKGQVVFFDFKSMTIVRAYPISLGDVHALDHAPTSDEAYARMVAVYEGIAPKPGILERFTRAVQATTLPAQLPRFLQVTQATIEAEAASAIPPVIGADATVAQTWLADIVSEAISNHARVPMVPFAKGYAVGNVMSLRVSDGAVYELRLPSPDYSISVTLHRFRKVPFGQSAAGASLVYGSYVQLRIEEPLLGKVYLDAELKNGAVKRIPATQDVVDDFPAYYDSLNGLFVNLAQAIDGQGGEWIKSAAAAPGDIDRQISATREMVKLCR